MHDCHLQDAVIAELGWDPQVNVAHIGVTAHDGTRSDEDIAATVVRRLVWNASIPVGAEGGTVTLTGTAPSLHDCRAAEFAAWSPSGTANAENRITVA